MGSGLINFSISHDVGIITLNRPEARNALSTEMFNDLAEAIRSCRSPDVRAVLITGSGEAFCAGADVRQFDNRLEDGGPQGISSHLREAADGFHKHVILEIRRLEKPVVAGVNGVAAGGGFSLMLSCDLRVASESARFLMAYAGIGAAADGGSTYLLPRLVGASRAMELYLASQPINAQAALAMGLVSQVFPADGFGGHALETAVRLAQGPTKAYGRVKAMMDRSWQNSLEDQLDLETSAMADIALTSDFQEGIKAFAGKRRPWFQGK
jgi:2-(1,2-epoxy-1,2-dihydrophenyl)acetyl-CoA isomerase